MELLIKDKKMFTKNAFTQKDSIVDLVSQIAEADYKNKMEELKGQQHKLDKNKNNKVDADDFKILRGEKKAMKEENVEEANNPFDYKNYKSQIPSKPGEKAGFDSKKTSTGTVYSRKAAKDDDSMKKEEIDPKDTTVDTLKGREKTSSNPNLSKKVMMDVPGNVKEEAEQIEERTLSKGETAEKERIVKGMKKSLAGFKARYGDRAKSVMYATATKAAKKD
jgi:hypothetical protein